MGVRTNIVKLERNRNYTKWPDTDYCNRGSFQNANNQMNIRSGKSGISLFGHFPSFHPGITVDLDYFRSGCRRHLCQQPLLWLAGQHTITTQAWRVETILKPMNKLNFTSMMICIDGRTCKDVKDVLERQRMEGTDKERIIRRSARVKLFWKSSLSYMHICIFEECKNSLLLK